MAEDRRSVSVVIPAYNESACIGTVLTESVVVCERLCDNYEIIVIDDCSSDETAAIVEEHARRNERIRIIRNQRRIGCHPSELVGLLAATMDLIAFIPADLQIRPNAVSQMVDAAADNDMVIAVRRNRQDAAIRRLMAGLYGLVIRLLFSVKLPDIDSATLYTRDLIRKIGPLVDPAQPFIPVEIALRAVRLGKRIGRVEIDHYPRRAGRPSSITPTFLVGLPLRFARFCWTCWRSLDGQY